MAYLVGTQGLVAGTKLAIEQEVTVIGREAGCDLVVEDSTVSRKHARIEKQSPTRFILFDEDSANGVWINDVRVKQVRLQTGDKIKIGDNLIVFEQ